VGAPVGPRRTLHHAATLVPSARGFVPPGTKGSGCRVELRAPGNRL
jgi:hypothetical protein